MKLVFESGLERRRGTVLMDTKILAEKP